jgi:hypothetical protein
MSSAIILGLGRKLRGRAGLVLAALLVALTLTGAAQAHKEPMHGVATMLSYEYLKHRAVAGNQRSSETITHFQNVFAQIDQALDQDRYVRIILAQAPDVALRSNHAPTREEPGLSGYLGEIQGANSLASAEIPDGDAALLGFLTAHVDRYTDVWGDAKSPYEIAMETFDDAYSSMGEAILDAYGGAGAAFVAAATSWCENDGGGALDRLQDFGCSFVKAFAAVPFGLALVPALVAAGLGALFDDPMKEGILEDAISGCDQNTLGDSVIDGMVKGKCIDSDQIQAMRDDRAFYGDLGIGFKGCDQAEELLEHVEEFRTPGAPRNEPEVLFMQRARLVDLIRSCQKVHGGSPEEAAEDCGDDAKVDDHFRTKEYWALSAEAYKRRVPTKEHWRRWTTPHSFSSMTHFMDLLSPVDYPAPVTNLGRMRMRAGRYHAWDGYSLKNGAAFRPDPELFASLRLDGSRLDEDILGNAERFDLVPAESADGYMILRRRVCEGSEAGLRTDDNLGASDCSPNGATPATFNSATLVETMHPPADLGALDGFVQWTFADLPPTLSYQSAAGEGRAYTYYNQFLPFLVIAENNAGSIPNQPLLCHSPLDCTGASTPYISWMNRIADAPSTSGKKLAFRLRGLSLAMHMIQDMTVPHHLAPTTAYGHQDYEAWFASWAWVPKTYPIWTLSFTADKKNGIQTDVGANTLNRWGRGTQSTYQQTLDSADPVFWRDVDRAYDALTADMASLANHRCPVDKFAVRRLAWAVAQRTIAAYQSVYRTIPMLDFLAHERADLGFWITSAIAARQYERDAESCEPHPDVVYEMDGWREVGENTLPFLVAAGAILLESAAAAADDPQTTCDLPSSQDQSVASAALLSVEAECRPNKKREIEACLAGASGAGASAPVCASLSTYNLLEACRGAAKSGYCSGLVDAAAGCICSGATETMAGIRAVQVCINDGLATTRALELYRSGSIDAHTFECLADARGCGLTDRDFDGIPDVVDACPDERPIRTETWLGTRLSTSVCWLDASRNGVCGYGCVNPVP